MDCQKMNSVSWNYCPVFDLVFDLASHFNSDDWLKSLLY